jgi:hypothetical protein
VTEPAYASSYENFAYSLDDDGVLVLRFHTNGGPVVFTGRTHQDLPAALEQIPLDRWSLEVKRALDRYRLEWRYSCPEGSRARRRVRARATFWLSRGPRHRHDGGPRRRERPAGHGRKMRYAVRREQPQARRCSSS